MRRLGLLAALLAVSACDCNPVRRCNVTADDCPRPSFCSEGFCVVGDGGTGGGGVGGGGGGGTSSGFCDAGLSCKGFEECVPSAWGGSCVDSQLQLTWAQPANASRIAADAGVQVRLTVKKSDGGTATSVVPVLAAGFNPDSSTLASPGYTAMLKAPAGPEGTVSIVAGWPDAGPTAVLSLFVDVAPPTFTVAAIALPSYDGGTATFLNQDPLAPSAIRKDETVKIRVTSNDVDVASASLQVFFDGGLSPDGGANVDSWNIGQAQNCDAGAFCSEYTVAMGPQPMHGFRGDVFAAVNGSDTVGHSAAPLSQQVFGVTRWKWAARVSAGGGSSDIRASPAVGDAGVIYVGVDRAMPNGGLFGVTPAGSISQFSSAGPVVASPAIGRTATQEFIFFLTTNGGVQTVPAQSCGAQSTDNVSSIAIMLDGQSGMRATAVAGSLPRRLVFLDPASGCSVESSSALNPVPSAAYPANVVTTGSAVFYPASNGVVKRFSFTAGNAVTTLSDSATINAGTIFGLSLYDSAGTKVGGGSGGAGVGRLFVVPENGGTITGYNQSLHVSGVAIGQDAAQPALFAVTQESSETGTLRKFDAAGVPIARASNPLPMPFPAGTTPGTSTPVLGSGGLVYATASDGTLLVAKQSDLTTQWAVAAPAPIAGAVTASATLDCNRERPQSSTGVFYFANGTGWLIAYIVDSPGLDSSAFWPKYQHDARNTGNTGVSIGCP